MSKIYFVFAKDLHIPPSEIDEMYWYDIMFILKEYTTYVEESNEESQRQEEEYRSKMQDVQQPKVPEFKMPDMSSLAKGFRI